MLPERASGLTTPATDSIQLPLPKERGLNPGKVDGGYHLDSRINHLL
jgi:hypothetical protein